MLSPAKINISLRILGKRPDGFHELDTLMTPIALSDSLTFTPSPDGAFSLTCSDPSLPVDESNLVTRAARLLESELGRPLPWNIHLEKSIPHGAGMGGGSSNAATAMAELNRLEGSPLPDSRLLELCASLGSDIPFFLSPKTTRCTGRGEILSPAPPCPSWPLLLLKPAFGVSTPDAYRDCLTAPELPDVDYSPVTLDGVTLVNDLQRPVFRKFPFLAVLKSWLSSQPGVRAAMMTGSGSTVFAVLEESADAARIAARAREELDPTLWTCATRTLSPDSSPAC